MIHAGHHSKSDDLLERTATIAAGTLRRCAERRIMRLEFSAGHAGGERRGIAAARVCAPLSRGVQWSWVAPPRSGCWPRGC